MSMAEEGSRRAADEAQLADHAQRLTRFPTGWRAVYIHLSNLRAQNRQEHHVRIAAASFEPLIRRFDGRLFRLENNDYVFACKGAEASDIEAIIEKLRFLFSEDPLTIAGASDGRRFTTWFDISKPNERDTFKQLADQLYTRAEERRNKERQNRVVDVGLGSRNREQQSGGPLTPELLAKLEEALGRMDIRSLIRRQPICAIIPNNEPRLVFNELFIAMAELTRQIMPGVDLFADRWLFQRLTQSLDKRVLAALPDMKADLDRALSVNINVTTLLSNEFLHFDSQLRAATKKSIVFELQTADIFSDMGAYMFARDFVHDRGYRLCIDGLTHFTFPLVNREDLGVDLKKMYWAPDLGDEGQEARRENIRQSVAQAGAARVILCRCDDEKAIEFGQLLGISLYQGRYIDNLLANTEDTTVVR
jgi:EAL domain-containing protein (putative c-di-GMP-specific phosphodiesterase class I)